MNSISLELPWTRTNSPPEMYRLADIGSDRIIWIGNVRHLKQANRPKDECLQPPRERLVWRPVVDLLGNESFQLDEQSSA